MKNFIDKNRNAVNSILNLTLKILSNNMINNKYLEVKKINILSNNMIFLNEKINRLNSSEKKSN